MSIAEIIEAHVSALPAYLQREALDYITYLESRHGIKPPANTNASSDATERFIARHAGVLDADFPDDIDIAKTGIDCPRESF